ncbi:putative L protein [Trifolium pratense virus B]|uniref:Replicase n=2 Tax=Trifolium pratense virus B TaxID=2448907 RepID=A0A510C2D4_9RHAB|nr:putative L protein [Trifolium pratense virus B]AYH53273.1 putative L protein [Trifolium pratense virus B]
MEIFNEDGGRRKNQFDSLPDYHLQNPLYSISDLISKVLNRQRVNNRFYQSYRAMQRESSQIEESNPIKLRELASRWFNDSEMETIQEIAGDCDFRLDLDSNLGDHFDISTLKESWEIAKTQFPIDYWITMRGLQNVLLSMNAVSSRRPPPPRFSSPDPQVAQMDVLGGRLIITGSLLGFKEDGSTTLLIFASDWLRSVSDLYTERFLVHFGANIGRNINRDHYPESSDIEYIINWGDAVLGNKGNSGFKLLKAYEALVLGVLQNKSQSNFVDPGRFLRNTLNDILEEDLWLGEQALLLVDHLSNISSAHHLIQLFGLHRIWGHPIVDPGKGMEKVIIIGQKDITKEGNMVRNISNHFKRMLLGSYKSKHGVYPNISSTGKFSDKIRNNEDWASIESEATEEDWEDIHFDKTFAVPESFNLSMIVADKSVSPTLSELKENILSKKSVMNMELRRGVLRWINHESIDPREFLEQVSNGNFPHDHKIIGLRSKERELNPTPRMFALMSHLMRVYVVITESMLSEHILPYFPQITMTDSQLDLTKKMYSTVKNQSVRTRAAGSIFDSKTVCMSLDFEKWNGHMRKESTLGVFRSLGELFGMPELYNMTYDIFKDSFFYLADGSYVPMINEEGDFVPEPPYSFTGHKGGQEGLRQKGWTIFTVVGLDWICRKHNCTYKIMGMGDNQVLQLTFYTYRVDASGKATTKGIEEMRKVLFGLFDDLLDVFSELGLPLKPLETWISEDLFVYGKYPVLRGVPLTMDLKKVMRIFPFSNQDTMTVENVLNTIAGNAQAATQSAPFIGVSYVVGLFMGGLCSADLLKYHPLIAKGLMEVLKDDNEWGLKFKEGRSISTPVGPVRISKEDLRRLMFLVPRILGGYVSFNIWGLLMRGFPDPLSASLSQLYAWKVRNPRTTTESYLLRWMKPLYMPERSMKLLVEDVSSVNLLAPVTPTAGLRRVVEQFLSDGRVIKNSEFRDLMTSRDPEVEEIISEHLCSGRTLHIRLIHDIMEATIFGYIKSITSKVTKSSTIVSLAIGKSRGDPLRRLMMDEENYFKFFVWRCSVEPDYDLPPCPTDLCKSMRREGWGKELIGVTVAFPWSYLRKTECFDQGRLCDCLDGCISLYLPDSPVTRDSWNYEIGTNPPYLGSVTKEKVVVTTGARIYSGEPLVKRPINLMRVIGWFVPEESETAKVILQCVRAVSDIDPLRFRGVTEGTSGSEIHRFKDTSLKHGALCSSNYLFSTRYHVSTDTFTRYSKGAQNYDMLFQANLCAIIEGMHQYILRTNNLGLMQQKTHHYRQVCYSCINPLDEEFHDIETSRLPLLIPSKKTNRYLFVPEEKISMVLEYKPHANWVFGDLSEEEFERMGGDVKLDWLTDSIADNIVIDITGTAGEESFTTVSLMDIKEHNRLFYMTASPRDVFFQLCNRIMILAEWRCMTKSDWKIPTQESVIRAAEAIILDTPVSKWYGLSGFFSWPSSMEKYYFCPEMQEPDTIPVTSFSACRSIRQSLMGLVSGSRQFPCRKTRLFSEDSKQSKLVLKLMIYDWVKANTECRSCWRAVGTLSTYNLSSIDLREFVCSLSHYPLQNYSDTVIKKSRVTLDSLRKSCDSSEEYDYGRDKVIDILPLELTTCITLFESGIIRAELIPYSPLAEDDDVDVVPIPGVDLFKIVSLPTNAAYKYLEIFSREYDNIMEYGSAFVTGNGLGGTSQVLSELCGGFIVISTLLDTGSTIPQIYPHCDSSMKNPNPGRIESSWMVDRVNDVMHDNWESDWKPIFDDNDIRFLVSDIEIIGKGSNLRDDVIRKLITAHPWEYAIVKDYIYSRRELELRLSYLLGFYDHVELITCNTRQRMMPEVWWVLKGRSKGKPRLLGYHRAVIRQQWECLKVNINQKDWALESVLSDLNERLATKDKLISMMIKAKTAFSLPIVGCAFPHKGGYTRLLGYLQRGKRPIDISIVAATSGKRLYTSDYEKVRWVLFGLACSMCGRVADREKLMNESENWMLDWKPSGSKNWVPYLWKSDEKSSPIHVYDYIPILSLWMKKEKLLFECVDWEIEFYHTKSRKECCFPITKTAEIKFKVK